MDGGQRASENMDARCPTRFSVRFTEFERGRVCRADARLCGDVRRGIKRGDPSEVVPEQSEHTSPWSITAAEEFDIDWKGVGVGNFHQRKFAKAVLALVETRTVAPNMPFFPRVDAARTGRLTADAGERATHGGNGSKPNRNDSRSHGTEMYTRTQNILVDHLREFVTAAVLVVVGL